MTDVPADPTPVVAAVIRREEAYLVARRPTHKRHGGLWEFPGGKVLKGESHLEALHRELSEELGVRVLEVGESLFRARDPRAPFVIHFVETVIEGEPHPMEHSELRWAGIGALESLELAPADRRFVEEFLVG